MTLATIAFNPDRRAIEPATLMPTPAQYTAVGISTANLVPIIMWLSVWPLKPPSEAEAAAIAGLIIALGGLIHTIIQSYRR